MFANSARGQLNRENIFIFPPAPYVRTINTVQNLVSPDTGSALYAYPVPSPSPHSPHQMVLS